MSAPVRTESFFLPRNGCNIAPGADPAPEAVTEDFQNFGQRFFGADSSHRQMGASCVFVRQPSVCPTKVLALRGRAFSRVERLSNPKLWILTKKEHSSPKLRVTSILSGSMKSRISASTSCSVKPDWSITAAVLSSKESSARSS